MKLLSVTTLLIFFFNQSIAQTKEPILLTDLLQIKTAGNLTATADGSKVAFTVTSIEPDDKSTKDYHYVSQLYRLDGKMNTPVQLTYSKEGSSSPVWSPDGSQLAFVRTADGKPQVFILPVNGGEAWQLTKIANGASAPRWSPDGKQLLFTSTSNFKDLVKDSLLNPGRSYPLWPMEKPGLEVTDLKKAALAKPLPDGSLDEVRAWLMTNEADGKATVLNKLNFQDEANISAAQSFGQLYTIAVNQMAKPVFLLGGFNRFENAAFTPDGKKLLITADVDSLENPDRSLESELYLANTNGRGLQLLLGKKGFNYGAAKISPTGKWLAYVSGHIDSFSSRLYLMPLSGKEADAVAIPFDRSINTLQWSSDEKYIYFTAQSNGGAPLYRLAVATRKIEPLSDYDSGITSFVLLNNKLLYTKTEVARPSEIYVADVDMKNSSRVSGFNDWVGNKDLSMPVKKTFVNGKGLTVEYWIMKPANFSAGKKFPLLLEIHGGPASMWGPGEASMWHEYQYFCSKGYGVVYSNPRGSGGYGNNFLRANVNDWGAGPTADVLTALDKTVAEGWADTSKLLVTGGSYAGYLVAWIVGHDHRFKAACSQRGVYDLATFFGEGNAWRLVPRYFGGYPWEPKVKEVLQRESPITYVQNISTPYIIFHGDNDRRTGFVQGEMMYRSLKVLGRPVEYVRHPGATHELTRSGDNRQRMDQLLRTYEFFERWIK